MFVLAWSNASINVDGPYNARGNTTAESVASHSGT